MHKHSNSRFLATLVVLGQVVAPLQALAATYRFDRLVKELRVTAPVTDPAEPPTSPIDPPIAVSPDGAFLLSSNELVFGRQQTGTVSEARSLLLTNTGGVPLTLQSITRQGAAPYQVSHNCPQALAAGASCEISATFSPSLLQSYPDSVRVVTNSGAVNFSLTGEGSNVTVPPPLKAGVVSLTPAESGTYNFSSPSQSYGTVEYGATATKKYFIRTNAENPGLTFGVRTDNPDFKVIAGFKADLGVNAGMSGLRIDTASCGATVSGGVLTNCKANALYRNGYNYGYFEVRYTPSTASTGPVSGNLIIDHNAGNLPSPYVIPLSAIVSLTGVADVTTTSLTLDGAPVGVQKEKSFSVLNTGQGALAINSIQLEGAQAADFVLVTSCQAALAGFSQCDVTVKGTPSAVGLRQAKVQVVTSGGSKAVTVNMTGQQAIATLAPTEGSSTSFGTSALGVSKTRTFVLANTGDTAITGLSTSFNGAAGFTLDASSTCSGTLQAGAQCLYVVKYTPPTTGEVQASFTVTGAAKDLPATLTFTAGLPYEVVFLGANNVRTWSDGTTATSCYTYLNSGNANYRYEGDVGSGFYRIKPNSATAATDVYCDMVNDGGGWTLVLGGPSVSLAGYSTVNAFGNTLQGVTATSVFKLSDAFINAVPRSNASAARYRLAIDWKGTKSTRFVGTKTYAHTACGTNAIVTSWGDPALTTGKRSPGVGYTSQCGLSDYAWSGTYNSGYFVTNEGNALTGGAGGSGKWGGEADVSVYVFVR